MPREPYNFWESSSPLRGRISIPCSRNIFTSRSNSCVCLSERTVITVLHSFSLISTQSGTDPGAYRASMLLTTGCTPCIPTSERKTFQSTFSSRQAAILADCSAARDSGAIQEDAARRRNSGVTVSLAF